MAAGSIAVSVVLVGAAAARADAAPLPPIALSQAGADLKRRPFARWTPTYPIVNVRVSTRPVRDPNTQPSGRYLVQAGFHDRAKDGPAPFWQSADDPLVPGIYHTAIQGDAPFQAGMPWTAFRSFRVSARRGEWTGHTSQKRYIRFTRSRRGALRGLALSVHARGCETYAALSLRREVRVRKDGRFSARTNGVSRRWIGAARARIEGRVRGGFARGVVEVADLFEGCSSGRVRWSARRR